MLTPEKTAYLRGYIKAASLVANQGPSLGGLRQMFQNGLINGQSRVFNGVNPAGTGLWKNWYYPSFFSQARSGSGSYSPSMPNPAGTGLWNFGHMFGRPAGGISALKSFKSMQDTSKMVRSVGDTLTKTLQGLDFKTMTQM